MQSATPLRWCVVLPPHGAARLVGLQILSVMQQMKQIQSVTAFDCNTYLSAFDKMFKIPSDDMAVDLMGNALVTSCFDKQIDAVLVLALSPVTLFVLNIFKKNSVKTVHWFYEDFAKAKYWNEVVGGYDLFCAIQHGPIETECAAAGSQYLFLPTATNLGFKPPVTIPEYDVSFIGIPSAYRIAILESLANAGVSLTIAGEGWSSYTGSLQKYIRQGKWTSAEDSVLTICSARIGINLSYSSPFENPEHAHISPRVYDVCGCGRVLLTEDVPLLQDSCSGLTYEVFDSVENAVAKTQQILKEYERFAEITLQNIATIFDNHTYTKRVEDILRKLHEQLFQNTTSQNR